MYISVVHRYFWLGEKLLCTTYNTPGVNLSGTLQVFDGCARSKAKASAVRNKKYTRASNPGERIFGQNWFIPGEYNCGSVLDWSSRRLQPLFMDFIYENKISTFKNMEEFFEKMTSHGTLVKYLCCHNAGEHQSKLQRACKKQKWCCSTQLHTLPSWTESLK